MKSKIEILYSPTFAKNYKKIPILIRKKAEKKEKIFRIDPFTPSLKTHKLTGKLSEYWSFSVDYKYRIVFRFISTQKVLLVDVGTHSVYR